MTPAPATFLQVSSGSKYPGGVAATGRGGGSAPFNAEGPRP